MDIFPSDIKQIIYNYDYAINYKYLGEVNDEFKEEYSMFKFCLSINHKITSRVNNIWYKLFFEDKKHRDLLAGFWENVTRVPFNGGL